MSGQLSIFKPEKMEMAINRGIDGFVRPTGGVNNRGPYEFTLPPQNSSYLQMGSIHLFGEMHVVHTDDSALEAGEAVSVVNLLGPSLFEKIEVLIDGKVFTTSSASLANYKMYFETMHSYGADARSTHLKMKVFELDTPGAFEDMQLQPEGANNGFHGRASKIRTSRRLQFITDLASDFLRSDRLLIPRKEVRIRLSRSPDAFCILSNTVREYKIVFQQLKLYYKRIYLHEPVSEGFNRDLARHPARYELNHTEMRNFTVGMGQANVSLTDVYRGALPKSLIIGFVNTASFNGIQHLNPYNFQHFNLSTIYLKVNGLTVPSDPFTPDFENGLYVREYHNLFQSTGAFGLGRGNSIGYRAFKNGSTFFPFDLSPDNCHGYHLHPKIDGTLDVELRFSEPLPQSITILIHATFDNLVKILSTGELVENIF